jgi:signal peptidase I
MTTVDEAGRALRALAAAAAPTARARPDLARVVLDRADRGRRTRRWRPTALTAAAVVVVAAAVAAAMMTGRGPYFTVIEPSSAMEPSIGVGESVVFDRTLTPGRGDVVHVRLEREGRRYDSMLRVLGVGGDRVGCPDTGSGGCVAVVVNGVAVPEPFLPAGTTAPFPTGTVPPGTLFLLGDHRAVAVDSRMFGPVPVGQVSGVAVEVVGVDGTTRAVPGAPAHDRPGDGDNVDPAGPLPPAPAVPGGN